MIIYILYRIGYFLAMTLPLKISYALACFVADMYYYICGKDRKAVIENIRVITGGAVSEADLARMAKDVFRNFAKYLVDFFRFSKIDEEYMKKFIKVDGLENIDKGLAGGKGVIALSAHIGNWELGGFVLSSLRNPMKAVVLTHQNKLINDFFTRQRSIGNMRPVEIGISLRSCYNVLKDNGLLALLGDRDFSRNGFRIDFFGKNTLIPKGPAVFSSRIGSCIVPTFMIREEDDTFRLIIEPPIFPREGQNSEAAAIELAKEYTSVIESYVRRYPTQWYMFREVWSNHEKTMRPDTII